MIRVEVTDSLVGKVTAANGFTPKSARHSNGLFRKRDVELLYSDQFQTLTIRSSFCPFIPFKMNSRPWEVRCHEYTKQIEDGFKDVGIPLRQLSITEFQSVRQGEE
jgi:hypothetical protein